VKIVISKRNITLAGKGGRHVIAAVKWMNQSRETNHCHL